jgi:hypothetical protein
MRKLLASTAAGLALASGAVALGTFGPVTAFAQDHPATASQPAAGETAANGRHGHWRHKLAKAVVKDAADTIGIPAKDLLAALKDGQSIAEVATAHGVDPQAVIDDLIADATTRIDQAVTDGKITAERAATMKTKLPDRVTTIVNRHFDGSHKPAK